jgi:RNA polymerase sigma-70 factor (ECF subfamily)
VAQGEKTPAEPAARILGESTSRCESDEFFREHYRPLLRAAMYAGASLQEAEDAVMTVMEDVLLRWDAIDQPAAYARRAVMHAFLKARERGLDRIRRRQVERRDVPRDGEDPALTVWTDQQWIAQLLGTLPPAQRDVIDGVLADLTTAEISVLLGKTPAAVRQNLHAARQRLKAALGREDADEQGGRRTGSSRKEAR